MYKPIVIVGAPRSGTNVLRDVMTMHPSLCTWPCDEINYLWRHVKPSFSSDEYPVGLLNQSYKKFISRHFSSISKSYNSSVVVEKTCANSLRLPFVDAALDYSPFFVFIHRNPYDAIVSAVNAWNKKPSLLYLAKKSRFIPVSDYTFYICTFFPQVLDKFNIRPSRSASWWGPKFKGYSNLLGLDTLTLASHQWSRCVSLSSSFISNLDPSRYYSLSYESFVHNPITHLSNIFSILNFPPLSTVIADKVQSFVSPSSVNKSKSSLTDRQFSTISDIATPTFEFLNDYF